jgi:hypothetical protein
VLIIPLIIVKIKDDLGAQRNGWPESIGMSAWNPSEYAPISLTPSTEFPQESRPAFRQVNLQQSVNGFFHGLHSILVLLKRNNIHFGLFRQLKTHPLLYLPGLSSQNG